MKDIVKQKVFKQFQLTGKDSYDSHIRAFNSFLQETGMNANQESIKNYWKSILARDYSPNTLNLKRFALKAGIHNTFKRESDSLFFRAVLDQFFKKEIKNFKTDPAVSELEVITKDEYEQLLDGTTERASLIIETLATTGLRVSELLNLQISKSEIKNGIYFFKIIGKGSKQRQVYLKKSLVNRIIKAFHSTDQLFLNRHGKLMTRRYIHNEISCQSRRLIGRAISPHKLRHSFASWFVQDRKNQNKPIDIKGLSKYLGHSSVSITMDLYVNTNLKPEDVL